MTAEREAELTAGEFMTIDQIAEFLGFGSGPQARKSANNWLTRFGVEAERMARTEDVVAAKAQMPGRGRRPRHGLT